MREAVESCLIIGGFLLGVVLLLMTQVWFWLAVIAITLINVL